MSIPTARARYSAATSDPRAVVVTHDGLPVVVTSDPLAFLHAVQPGSADYATTHGGYAILERPTPDLYPTHFAADLRGAAAFALIAERRGYGRDGLAVRLCLEVQRLADDLAGESDYVAVSDVLLPLCTAAIGALSYVTGDLDSIRHRLDSAIRALAVRGGADAHQADAL